MWPENYIFGQNSPQTTLNWPITVEGDLYSQFNMLFYESSYDKPPLETLLFKWYALSCVCPQKTISGIQAPQMGLWDIRTIC